MDHRRIIAAISLLGAIGAATHASAMERGGGAGDKAAIKERRAEGREMGPPMGMKDHRGMRGPGGMMVFEVMRYLYPIELVRRHASEIKLTDEQIKKIHKANIEAEAEVEQLKWDIDRESQKLTEMIKNGEPREAIYKQMDKLFGFENTIKKKHLGLMISVRDILNKGQRELLDKMKEEDDWHHERGPFPGGQGFMSDDPLMPGHGPPPLASPLMSPMH